MALTGIISLPMLRGTVVVAGPWAALFGRVDQRIYPYEVGCMVRTTATVGAGGTINTQGLGQFVANDYAMVCTAVAYGDISLFVPDTGRIIQVTGVSGADDVLTVGAAVTVIKGEYLLNIGTDSMTGGAMQFDGSSINLYTDNVGNDLNSNAYIVSATGGWYRGWVQSGITMVDLLITNESNVPAAVKPFEKVTIEE